jgi:hypothetical protein
MDLLRQLTVCLIHEPVGVLYGVIHFLFSCCFGVPRLIYDFIDRDLVFCL